MLEVNLRGFVLAYILEVADEHFCGVFSWFALWYFDREEGVFTDSSSNGNTLTGRSVGFFPVELEGKLSATWAGVKSGCY
jgi:hypothetical protein